MKVYLLCQEIDLGYHVVDVYSSLDKLGLPITPKKVYKYLGKQNQEEFILEDQWDVLQKSGTPHFVQAYEVK